MTAEILAAFLGGFCSIPALYVLRRAQRHDHTLSFAKVLAYGLAPFLVLQLALLVVWLVAPQAAPRFGLFAALTFLGIVATGALRGWLEGR